MEYGDYIIEPFKDAAGHKARVTRKDGRHFCIAGSDRPFMPMRYADTAFPYGTEEEAVTEAKAIADSSKP